LIILARKHKRGWAT